MTTSANTLPPVASISPNEQQRYEGYQERLRLSVDDLATHTAANDLNQLVAPQLTQLRGLPMAANLSNLDLYNDLSAATNRMTRGTKHSRDTLDRAIDDELRTNASHYASLSPSQLEAACNMVRKSVFEYETSSTTNGTKIIARPQHYRRALRQNATVLREAQQVHTHGDKDRLWTKIRYPGAYAAALVTSSGFYAQQKFKERMAAHRKGATDPEIRAGTAGVAITGLVVVYALTRSLIALKHGFDAPHTDLHLPHIDTPDVQPPKVVIPTPHATLPDIDAPKVTPPQVDFDPDTPQTYHVVKGDTLREIARDTLQDAKKEAGSTTRITNDMIQDAYQQIARDNHIADADRIYPGQHLKLSSASHTAEQWFKDDSRTASNHTPTKRPTDLPAQQSFETQLDEYRISRGEGLYEMLGNLGIKDKHTQTAFMHHLDNSPSIHHALTSGRHPLMYDNGHELRLSRPGILSEGEERRLAEYYQQYMKRASADVG